MQVGDSPLYRKAGAEDSIHECIVVILQKPVRGLANLQTNTDTVLGTKAVRKVPAACIQGNPGSYGRNQLKNTLRLDVFMLRVKIENNFYKLIAVCQCDGSSFVDG